MNLVTKKENAGKAFHHNLGNGNYYSKVLSDMANLCCSIKPLSFGLKTDSYKNALVSVQSLNGFRTNPK